MTSFPANMHRTRPISGQTKTEYREIDKSGPWVLRCAPGLGRLLANEMAFFGAASRNESPLFLRQRGHDLLFIQNSKRNPPLSSLRIAEEVHYCLTYGRFKVSKSQIERLAATLRAQERPFRLIVTAEGSHFSRQDMKRWLGRELTGLRVKLDEDAPTALYTFCIDQAYYICLLHSSSADASFRRERSAERVGSLPPTIAAAVAFLGKPVSSDVALDPVCGTGTLLSEAYAYCPAMKLIGIDSDPVALRAARRNLSHAPDCNLLVGDATDTKLASGSITLFLANLPFGKRFGNRETNPQLYRGVIAEMRRLGMPGKWRAVLLTSDTAALEKVMSDEGDLTTIKRTKVTIRGEPAVISVICHSRQTTVVG